MEEFEPSDISKFSVRLVRRGDVSNANLDSRFRISSSGNISLVPGLSLGKMIL